MAGYAIETSRLTRDFGQDRVVNQVTLRVARGETYGFLGLNGAGKSTTIKMLTTLLPPTSGKARIFGHDVERDPLAVRRKIGFVGEEGGVDAVPHWTTMEYLCYFARLQHAGGRRQIEEMLDFMGLDRNVRHRRISTMSTGMKRRVEIARAFLGRPDILFLDEPTRGLDLPSKRELWEFFRHLNRNEKVTIFLSSHEVPEIQFLCNRLSVIAQGRLTYSGPTHRLGVEPDAFENALIRLLSPNTPSAKQTRIAWSR